VSGESASCIALHESGHATIALALGLHVSYATIRPNDLLYDIRAGAGCLEVDVRNTGGHVMVMFNRHVDLGSWAVMLLAGRSAERHAFGDCWANPYDMSEARRFVAFELFTARTVTDEEIEAALPAYEAKADQLVGDNWGWIQRVAHELDRITGLCRDEILALRDRN
jgi:hypothetical protein